VEPALSEYCVAPELALHVKVTVAPPSIVLGVGLVMVAGVFVGVEAVYAI
jgi:hypothetical protein